MIFKFNNLFLFKSQPPPLIEKSQQNEETDEQVIDQNKLSNSQQFQQNERQSRFHKGPQPLMVRFVDCPEK